MSERTVGWQPPRHPLTIEMNLPPRRRGFTIRSLVIFAAIAMAIAAIFLLAS